MRSLMYTLVGILTAVVGHALHGSLFWAIIDFAFWPFVWAKWLIFHEVNLAFVQNALTWFFR